MFETWIRKLRQNSHHRARTSRQTGTRISSMRARPRVEPLEERCLLDADLALTKTALPEPVLPGQNLAYTLAVTNNGPDTATATTLTDTLPAGLTFINAVIPNGASFTNSSGNLTFALGDLASGATATVTINVTATATGSVSNTASVSSSINDPDLTNNSSTATSTINAPTAPADLAVSTFTSPASVVPGQALTYTIDVTNNGTGTATNTSLTDVLPTGVTFISATTPAGTTFTNTNGTLVFTLGDMAPGAVNTVTIEVTPSAAGDITNTATATTDAGDANVADNQSTTTVTVNANSTTATDLAITKSATPEPVVPGQLLTYTLGVTNNGPSDVTDATVTDVVPSGLTFINATTPSGTTFTNSNGVLTLSLGNLASGASDTITLLFTPNVSSTTAQTLTNTATVTTSAGDTNPANNQATATTTVNPASSSTATDLAITKTASPEPVVAGQLLTYTLTVSNNGSNGVTDATVTDVLPAGLTFINASTPAGTTFTNVNGVLTFSLGSIAAGASDTITLLVTPSSDVTAATSITNTATVTSSAGDTNPANNQATATSTVNPTSTGTATDLVISKTSSPEPALPGQAVTYTIQVSNAGPNAVTDATVTDVLPSGVTFINATTPTGTTFTNANGVLTFNLGSLANGASETITVLVTPTGTGTLPTTLTNTATVTSSAGDTTPGNNQASATTTVNANSTTATDLAVTKSASTSSLVTGQDVTYTLIVTNNGTNGVTDATLTDVVPAGLTLVSASTSAGTTFTNANGVLTFTLGSLAAGASDTITLLMAATDVVTAATSLTNTATVTSSAGDTDVGNNQASATVTLNPNSSTATDLSVTKTADASSPVSGQPVTYTIVVTNNGTNATTDGTLTDVLPAGLTFISATAPSGVTFTQSNGVVTFTLGSLAAGASDTLTVTASSAGVGTFTDTATVTSSAGDTNFANNQATVTSTVAQAATSVTVSATPNPFTVGQAVTITATVTPVSPGTGTPTGTVTFTDNGNFLNTVTLVGGVATLSTSTLTAGSHTIVATYSGDANFSSSSGSTTVSSTSTTGTCDNQTFVTQVYRDLLNREPDAGGLAAFTDLLNSNQATRAQVVLAVEASPEFRMDVVERLYEELLGRSADASGLSAWTDFLANHTQRDLEAALLASPEFFQRAGGTNTAFLQAVYQDVLHRAIDPSGLAGWGDVLGDDPDDVDDRVRVALAILNSQESNTLTVDNLYQEFLNRAPDTGGLAAFTAALQAGMSVESAISLIVGSDEFCMLAGGSTSSMA